MQKTANTQLRPRNSAAAITTHSSESAKIQTPTQVRHTKGDDGNSTGNLQETQRLQEEHYLGIREVLKSINTTMVTIVGVLQDLVNTRRDTVAQQGAPDTSLDDVQPTTSTGASGQEAPPQDHDTSTPPPADGEPPRERSLRSRNKTENIAKTPARK
ncbi:hypothetical protein NDU88_004178 [Pleurodeles waltl]|uniref:Uncharacterized protein n=1 Tax=Pleurodeles waltl TaxID=8319 RepID=A0AAV7MVQ7_PLEWA|nr:hypothetical protein NDU88_004178 [Pleurodeles waltl]